MAAVVAPVTTGAAVTALAAEGTDAETPTAGTISNAAPPTIQKLDARRIDPLHISENIVNELLLICSVIGSTDPLTNKFVPVTDCLNWLQDLQRALRRDDDTTRTIALLLGSWQIVQKKLLPIVLACQYDSALVMTIVKLLVILTKPMNGGALKAARLVIDVKKSKQKKIVLTEAYKKEHARIKENALDQAQKLLDYKAAFLDSKHSGALRIIVSLLMEPLARTGSARTENDHMTIELVLHLIRNLLSAGCVSYNKQEDARLHQQMIALFQRELVLDIITMLAQDIESRENQHYNLLIMEILHYLFRGQDPAEVAAISLDTMPSENTSQQKSSTMMKIPRNNAPIGSLKSVLRAEKSKRNPSIHSARHGNFGGTIVLASNDGKNKKIVGTTTTLNPNGSAILECKVAPKSKKKNVIFKNIANTNALVTSQFSIHTRVARNVLHEFCTGFLKKCYGPLMKSLKNEFRRDSSRLEKDDKVNYFSLVRFFSHWHRLVITKNAREKGQKETINELIFTMDTFSFNLVIHSAESFLDLKQYQNLEKAVSLYLEMLKVLNLMAISKDETENIMALGLLNRLFFNKDPINKIQKLISNWKVATYSKQYLCDLVELQYVAFKMLDVYKARKPVGENSALGDKHDRLLRMQSDAAEFDIDAFFGRLATHHMIFMSSQLLSQYHTNTPQTNHFVIAFFVRLSKFVIEPAEEEGGSLQVTLEPLLYSIPFIKILSCILNDASIKNDKSFTYLLSFATTIVRHFATACERNPLLYVECLFGNRHVTKSQCRNLVNCYVGDELKSMIEREKLLEAQRKEVEEMDERISRVPIRQHVVDDNKYESSEGEDEWQDDEEEEEERPLTGSTKRSKEKKLPNSSLKWLKEEDELIRVVVSKSLSLKYAISSLLKEGSGLRDKNRTKKRVKNRMKKLGLNQAGGLFADAKDIDEVSEDLGGNHSKNDDEVVSNTSLAGEKRKVADEEDSIYSPQKKQKNEMFENHSELAVEDNSMPLAMDISLEESNSNEDDGNKSMMTSSKENVNEKSSQTNAEEVVIDDSMSLLFEDDTKDDESFVKMSKVNRRTALEDSSDDEK